jgi:plastocyanin
MLIPKGSANPEVDITQFVQKQWYNPSPITINVNYTVKWINNDTESHTVTSGLGGGLASAASTNSKGKPDGLFDSGLFKPGSSWSFKFNKPGLYNYFCTIHPWMEGIVNVKGEITKIPPSYAVNQNGNKINKFPIYNLTTDKKYEIGISWSPLSIKTNEPINFIIDAFKMPQNEPLHLWPYNFVLIQNGKEIYKTNGITQLGSSVEKYIFDSPGKAIIKIESSQDPRSSIEYGTLVYKNLNSASSNSGGNIQNTKSSSFGFINSLTLVYSVYVVIMGIPIALVVFIILIKKRII